MPTIRWMGLLAIASLACAGPAMAQASPQGSVEPALVLPTDPLERAESCAAYLAFGRAVALSHVPATATTAAQARDMETQAALLVLVARSLGERNGQSAAEVDRALHDKALAVSELARDFEAHMESLAANTAICHQEATQISQDEPPPAEQTVT